MTSVLPQLWPGALTDPYPEVHGGVALRCDRMLLHLCTHAAFHLGQAGYVRRAVTGDSQASGALSIKALADR